MEIESVIREKAEAILNPDKNNMGHALGIQFLTMSRKEIKATMPVNDNTVQPMRILHGGASVAFAETLVSVGAWLNIEGDQQTAVGIEINANHIRSVPEGDLVTGVARPLHRGSKTQVWETRITTSDGKLVSISRCTVAIVPIRRDNKA